MILFFLSPFAWAQTSPLLNMSPAESASIDSAESRVKPPSIGTQEGKSYRVFHLEFVDSASARGLEVDGVTVFNRFDRFADVFVQPDRATLKRLAAVPGLRWADSAGSIEAPPPVGLNETGSTRALTEEIVRGGLDGLTGKGVVLAVVDTGVDIHHPDFVELDDQGRPVSRFEFFWDTVGAQNSAGSPAPALYPGGGSVGTVYTQEQLTAALRGRAQLPLLDSQGHGTACAGIAAGNGRALQGKYTGVAPKATLIGVRLGGKKVENSYLVGAIFDWLDRTAGDRPMVISNSWGSQFHGHDGTRVVERQIDTRFPPARKGRVVLFSAGNSGDEPLHAGASYGDASVPGNLEWKSDGGAMLVYFDSADTTLKTTPEMKKHDYIHPLTGQRVWEIKLPKGEGQLSVHSEGKKAGQFDAYIFGDEAAFKGKSLQYKRMVGTPGSASNVLTVGSYDFNSIFEHKGKKLVIGVGAKFKTPMQIGALSLYSSPGYSRSGAIKPDITAPGQWFTAPSPLDPKVETIRETSGKYRLFNGTSAATPYAAGVCALLLEKRPDLSLERVRKLLDEHATNDFDTEEVPNPRWGRGKLDLRCVKKMIAEL